MKKTLRVFLSALVILSASASLGAGPNESFSRGLLIAVDSRDHRACDTVQKKIEALVEGKAPNICAQAGRNPIRIVILTAPITEWDYLSEVSPAKNERPLRSISAPNMGTMFFVPASREVFHYFNLVSLKKKSTLLITHDNNFGGMMARGDRTVSVSFVLKSRGEQAKRTGQKVVDYLDKYALFAKGRAASATADENQPANNSTTVDLYRPPIACPDPDRTCLAREKGYSLGISVTIRF